MSAFNKGSLPYHRKGSYRESHIAYRLSFWPALASNSPRSRYLRPWAVVDALSLPGVKRVVGGGRALTPEA